jgi:Ca2+-binding EF-hand superfamily protein
LVGKHQLPFGKMHGSRAPAWLLGFTLLVGVASTASGAAGPHNAYGGVKRPRPTGSPTAAAAAASPAKPAELSEQDVMMFLRLDANNDGVIDVLEFTASWHDAPFELWDHDDVDDDGKITREEFTNARTSSASPKPKPQPLADHFTLIDSDADACITIAEFEADWHAPPAGLFAQEDANGDGCIRRNEFGRSVGSPPQR